MYHDRVQAGRQLGEHLRALHGESMVVLGLPRGGVPVAAEVARALDAELDVIVVRKLGVPTQPELAMGALGEGGVRVLNKSVIATTGVTSEQLAEIQERELAELRRRAVELRPGHERLDLTGRFVLIVDDGIATGATARAACEVARAQGAARVMLAAPVAPPEALARLEGAADVVEFLATPSHFGGVGQFYEDFDQTTDEEVVELLATSRAERRSSQ